MTSAQFSKAIAKLGLSQMETGRVLGLYPRHIRRYVSGETKVPPPVRKLLKLALDGVVTVKQIKEAE